MSEQPRSLTVHGTCVAIDGGGVVLLGSSGAGKSDLALRLIDQGARLVADDQVILTRDACHLRADAPSTLKGLLEVRGVGILSLPSHDHVPLRLAVHLERDARLERLPEPEVWYAPEPLGLSIPLLRLKPFEVSTPAKIKAWLRYEMAHGPGIDHIAAEFQVIDGGKA